MKVWVEGYRSHNLKLNSALHNAAIWYCTILLGTRMAKNIELDIKPVSYTHLTPADE